MRVIGYEYVAVGNSTSKKDAQANAARDFCQFLVRQGEMNAKEVPGISVRLCLFFSHLTLNKLLHTNANLFIHSFIIIIIIWGFQSHLSCNA